MTDITRKTGWERLSNGFDVEFRHGIPVRLSDNGSEQALVEPALIAEIEALAGLQVRRGDWHPGAAANEREAPLRVSGDQLETVLERLALAAANIYIDRYGKPVDRDDVDWDTLEFDTDFRTALECCELAWGEVDKERFRDGYLEAMHRESQRLAASGSAPLVEPENY
jgi:hypothetical protein